MPCQLVWFKRDLRCQDHQPLLEAARHGQVLCLHVIESGYWSGSDVSARHYGFLRESLRDLSADLRAHGLTLHVVQGDVLEVLRHLHRTVGLSAIHAHEETGNAWTFARDRAVRAWCREQGVTCREYRQFGVFRGLADRDHWLRGWEAQMAVPCHQLPDVITGDTRPELVRPLPSATRLGLPDEDAPGRQHGGRHAADAVLASFLTERSASYRGGISSPLSAPTACSRLSPYLAWGCLSLREVVQATRAQQARLPPDAAFQRRGLDAFVSRLYWHCHFIQKLESEPELEWRNLHRGYDGLREADWQPAHFTALVEGRTGWPLVDACVAMLRHTGWINFRMRAMLVSVAAYPLWLHWRPVGEWLARQFVDYEPGIHWSQLQMQSGTTGINIPRIYNPIKQARDHDPQGRFVRRWLPALRQLPDAWLFEPWRLPESLQQRYGLRVGHELPAPVVDLEQATRLARQRLFERRGDPEVRAAKAAVITRHGSRQRPAARNRASDSRPDTRHQMELPL